MNTSLDNKETLFVLLAAVVKKAGSKLSLSVENLIAITKNDAMVMYYDQKTGDLTLELIDTPPAGIVN